MSEKSEKHFPKVVVGALIYDEKGNIFLAKSPKWENKWTVSGGHLEWGESLVDGVRREVKEETNLDVDRVDLVSVQESILSPEYHKLKHMIFLNYSCKTLHKDVILNDEFTEYVWLNPKDALEKLELGSSTTTFINQYIQKLN